MHLTPPTPLDLSDVHGDAVDLAQIVLSAIDGSELARLRWGKIPRADHLEYLTKCYEQSISEELAQPQISDTSTDKRGDKIDRFEHLVVRDLDLRPTFSEHSSGSPSFTSTHRGRIVAHAIWIYCPADWVSRYPPPPLLNDAPNHSPTPPAETNTALVTHFDSQVKEMGSLHVRGKLCYILMSISTLASHLRKGIATQLVRWIFPRADENGLPVYLAASPAGFPLYKTVGFVEIGGEKGMVQVPLGEWGGAEGAVHRHTMMVRQPSTLRNESNHKSVAGNVT